MGSPLQYTLFLLLAPIAAAATIAVLSYCLRHHAAATRPLPALRWLIVAIVGWLLFNTLELAASSPAATVFWAQVTYIFIEGTVVAWLALALQYTGGHRWLAPARFVWFLIVPAITLLLVWTNAWHGLMWREYEFMPVGGALAFRVTYGPWPFINFPSTYFLVFLAAFLLIRYSLTAFSLYRQQTMWLIIGAAMPVLTNLVYLFRPIPGLTKDYTPLSFALASMALMVGMVRYRLFDLKPVARDAVINGMADPMWVLDTQDRIVDLNEAAQRHIAAHASVSTGHSIGCIAAEVLPPWRAARPLLGAGAHTEDAVVLNVEVERRHFELRISVLCDERGQPQGRVVLMRDITDKMQVEAQLRQYAQELEARNAELDAYAHTVAHNLKSPLSIIVGYGDWLAHAGAEIEEELLHKGLHEIAQSGQRMARIVEDLLLLSSVRRQREVVLDHVDMAVVVDRALRRVAPSRHQLAQISQPQQWPALQGYAPWLEEVWVNYLSNAIKYGGRPDQGIPPEIELGFDEGAAADGRLRFWVRDNGYGMTQEQQAQLFNEFTRLQRHEAAGHGLGLSIVHRIVSRLGGEVGVESQVGQGSTFWFALPTNPTP